MPDSALPPNLKGKRHWDFPWGLRWVPRGWTAFSWGVPELWAGNQKRTRRQRGLGEEGPAPVGEPGSWQVGEFIRAAWWIAAPWAAAPFVVTFAPGWWKLLALIALPFAPVYIAFTLKGGRHFRIGPRWDDVNGYVEWPSIGTRKFPKDGERDTSTL